MNWLWNFIRGMGVSITVSLGTGYKKMEKPQSIWHPSPNFNDGRSKPVSCIVLHATATPGLASPLAWLCNMASKVSAHYLIDLDGTIYHLVLDENTAWHAGVSEWKGDPNVNHFSVGIELVNANDGKMPYPDAQVVACAGLVAYLMDEFDVKAEDVVRHADIAPGRKNDPLGFDMGGFKRRLV